MDHPLRILHVVVNMNRGGAETLIMNLYRNINRANVQFDFLTFKPGVFDTEIINMGGRVYRIPYITDVGPMAFTRAMNEFFKQNNSYKIIHSHMDKMSGLILKQAKQANIPIRIAHSHSTKSEGGLLSKMYKWYAGHHILNSATHLYACSNKAAKWLFGNKSAEGFILKNGIETDKFRFSINSRDTARDKLKIQSDTMVLGHVGRFSYPKNHFFLLDVFANLSKEIENIELLLIGDGILRQKIERKIKELNIENKVKVLGMRSDINQLLQVLDVFIMPSFHEGLPVTLIEAQGAGLPCLISNTITREVDMEIGLMHYLPLSDKKDWVQTILSLQTNKQQREIPQEALSNKGYDIRKTAKQTEVSYVRLGEQVI